MFSWQENNLYKDKKFVEIRALLFNNIMRRTRRFDPTMCGAMVKNHDNKRIHPGVKKINWERFDGKLWQCNYYEHIIRDEKSYIAISNYIITNPANWKDDKFYL
jgi:REP element-mobilizing transposase RayT